MRRLPTAARSQRQGDNELHSCVCTHIHVFLAIFTWYATKLQTLEGNPRAGDMANLVLQPCCKVFLSAGAGSESLSGLTFCMRLSRYMYGGTTALTARAALTPDGEAQSTQLGA